MPLLLTLVAAFAGPAQQTAPARATTMTDLDGRTWAPLAPPAGDTHLVVFISADCPISSRYALEIGRIAGEYSPRRVRTFLVYAEPLLDVARIRSHAKEYHGKTSAVLIHDARLALADAVGATITPEAAVYSPAGRQYLGRIDDLYVQLGRTRPAPTRHDVREALDAVLAGRPVAEPETRAVGCFIERTRK